LKKRAIDRNKRSSSRGVRLFCALHPQEAQSKEILSRLDSIGPLPEHRVTPIDQLHMTVVFIGEVERSQVAPIEESVQRAASAIAPFSWSPDRIDYLPLRGPARTVAAIGPCCKALEELHQRLAQRLVRGKKGRSFLPHMTLARFKTPRPMIRIDESYHGPLLQFETVQLVRSRLLPTGAEHQVLLEVPFGRS